jgi:translation initiation factor 1
MADPLKDLQQLKILFPEMEGYVPEANEAQEEEGPGSLTNEAKSKMRLYVLRDKKRRGGKQVTLVEGFEGSEEARQDLHARLKSLCSAGGSLKDGELMIQGNHVQKVIDYLLKAGYTHVKQKGG